MQYISKADFRNEVVHLDNTHFTDCTLDGCTLAYCGGKTIFERTSFHGCHMLFEDAANRTVQLLQCLGYVTSALGLTDVTTILH